MKWDAIHPEQNRYDFAPADSIVRFARAHDMAVRGHTLVWYRQVPSWVTDRSWTRPELEQVLHDHIRRVVGHYRGKIAQWDVVNEAVDSEGQAARQRLDARHRTGVHRPRVPLGARGRP